MSAKLKRLLLTNLPYLLFLWLFCKLGAGWRLAAGADASAKALHLLRRHNAAAFHASAFCRLSIRKILLIRTCSARLFCRLAVYVKGRNAKKVP